jgi:hypothetical protein
MKGGPSATGGRCRGRSDPVRHLLRDSRHEWLQVDGILAAILDEPVKRFPLTAPVLVPQPDRLEAIHIPQVPRSRDPDSGLDLLESAGVA